MRTFLVVATLLLAGCLGIGTSDKPTPTDAAAAPAWPYPDGSEWPVGLVGPFGLASITNHTIPRNEGVTLFGSVLLPAVPEGVKVPTILEVGPYFDNEDNPTWATTKVSVQEPARPLEWVREGYAVAYWSVRGTGRSTGCFEMGGANEADDSAAIVQWLASQPWSNGRVGMMGLSYPGTTPIQAMSRHAPSLAAVAVMGTIVDFQLFFVTPEQEPIVVGGAFGAMYAGRVSHRPSPVDPTILDRHPDRVCPEAAEVARGGQSLFYDDDHDTPHWKERRYYEAGTASTAVFLQQGFDDAYLSGHMMQDRRLFEVFDGPKRMFEGQWGHSTPPAANIEAAYPDTSYTELTMQWFDYWLKGLGTPEEAGVGVFEFEDGQGTWHSSTSWPPAEHDPIILHLRGGTALSTEPAAGQATFQAAYGRGPEDPNCVGPIKNALSYTTEPAKADWLIAGNPDLNLTITSSETSGSLAVSLHIVQGSSGDGCHDGQWTPFSWGGANIRFAHGGLQGRDFPVGTPTPMHITLSDFAEVIPKGARLGLSIAGFEPFHRPPAAYPEFTIHEGDGSFLTIQAASPAPS